LPISAAFLEPYEQATVHVGHVLDALRAATVGDRAQHERLERVAPLVARRLAVLKRTIDIRMREGFDAARRFVLTQRGRNLMDLIRRRVAIMAASERHVLVERSAAARASARHT